MIRRQFFGAAAAALTAPLVPRRVYSFLWDEPRVKDSGFCITLNGKELVEGVDYDVIHDVVVLRCTSIDQVKDFVVSVRTPDERSCEM